MYVLLCTQVKGIYQAHQATYWRGALWLRRLSCYEPCCMGDTSFTPKCKAWYRNGIKDKQVANPAVTYEVPEADTTAAEVEFEDSEHPADVDDTDSGSESDLELDEGIEYCSDEDADYQPPAKVHCDNSSNTDALVTRGQALLRRAARVPK